MTTYQLSVHPLSHKVEWSFADPRDGLGNTTPHVVMVFE